MNEAIAARSGLSRVGVTRLKLGVDAGRLLKARAVPNLARTAARADALTRIGRERGPDDLIGDLVAGGQAQVGTADAGGERRAAREQGSRLTDEAALEPQIARRG